MTAKGYMAALARERIERRSEPTSEDLEDDEKLLAQGCKVYWANGIRIVIDLSAATDGADRPGDK